MKFRLAKCSGTWTCNKLILLSLKSEQTTLSPKMPWNLYFSHKIWDDIIDIFFLLWKDNTGTSLITVSLHFSNAWLIIFHLFLWLPFCFPNTRYMHWFQHNVFNKLLPVTFFQYFWICWRSTHYGLSMFKTIPHQQL